MPKRANNQTSGHEGEARATLHQHGKRRSHIPVGRSIRDSRRYGLNASGTRRSIHISVEISPAELLTMSVMDESNTPFTPDFTNRLLKMPRSKTNIRLFVKDDLTPGRAVVLPK